MVAASKFVKWTLLVACVVPLYGCTFLDSFVPKKGEETDVIDRTKNLTIKDFQDLSKIDKLTREANAREETNISGVVGAPPIPDVAQVLAAPRPPKVGNTKLVTLAVTDDVPLRDVLFELGRLAEVDIEVGPGLDRAGINLRATDRPFNEVIERIATLSNLRYSIAGKAIRVERDLPYVKNYSLDFLNLVRSSTSNYTLNTSVTSAGTSVAGGEGGGGGGGSGGGVGSSTANNSIQATAESDLWSALEASVTEILNYSPAGESTESSGGGGARNSSGTAVINRQAGVLSVNATERQHAMVKSFLDLMTRNASAQVLIEAKIVEVSLADQFASGVNWNKVIGDIGNSVNVGLGSYVPKNPVDTADLSFDRTGKAVFTMGIDRGDLGAVIALTQNYGTTRTLSSPRLSAINNQAAVLTFAKNQVYFDCEYEPASSSSTGTSTTTSTQASLTCERQTIPVGIIMTILPTVNLDTQEVTLNVRPTLTRELGTAVSPVTGFLKSQALIGAPGAPGSTAAANAIPTISVPIIESREIDSITKVKSGGVMIIGGLMEDASRNVDTGVPGVAEIPLFGNLFKGRSEDTSNRELIIFIKATIVNSDGSAHKVDKAVYDKFVTDPRPLFPQQ